MDKILEKYSSTIQDRFNLFRLVAFFFVVTLMSTISEIEYKSYTEDLLRRSINEVFNFERIKKEVSLGLSLLAICFISLWVVLFSRLAKGFMQRQTANDKYVRSLSEIRDAFSIEKDTDIKEKIEIGKYVDECSTKIAVRIKFLYDLAEFLFVYAWASLFSVYFGGVIDLIAFFVCMFFSFILLVRSQIEFLSKMSGFIVAKSLLFGVDVRKAFSDYQDS